MRALPMLRGRLFHNADTVIATADPCNAAAENVKQLTALVEKTVETLKSPRFKKGQSIEYLSKRKVQSILNHTGCL